MILKFHTGRIAALIWSSLLGLSAMVNGRAATDPGPKLPLPKVFLFNANYLGAMRERISKNGPTIKGALERLTRDADEALKTRPMSVVNKSTTPPSGDKHDYMSEAPYFWPDPASSNGLPYIRRDGERNPEINRITDHHNILHLPDVVETLGLAYYFTGNEAYAAKAAELLRVWFLDATTRMNPNLKYAQAIRGVNDGRGIGLIESRGLIHVVEAAGLLAGSKSWTAADQSGLQKWFGDFLDWMRHSKNGRDEAAAKNNHGTYYDVQVVSFALFLDRRELATYVLQTARQKRIAVQIEPDGRQPLELARTKAWSYSVGNLSGLMLLAKLGESSGVDLWHFETPDGRGIRRALEYLQPFATREKRWPYQQLGGWSPQGFVPLLRDAVLHYPDPKLKELLQKLSRTNHSDQDVLTRPPA